MEDGPAEIVGESEDIFGEPEDIVVGCVDEVAVGGGAGTRWSLRIVVSAIE